MHREAILLVFFSLLLLSSLSLSHKFSNGSSPEDEEEEEEVNEDAGVIRRSMFPPDFIFGVSTSAYQALSLPRSLSPLPSPIY